MNDVTAESADNTTEPSDDEIASSETDSVAESDAAPVSDEQPTVERNEAGDSLAPTAEAVLLHLCRSVVASPDAVSIDASSPSEGRVRFDVTVNKDDMGRVIGRRGRVASAIRTVVGAAGAKDGVSTEVEFVE